jgi:hypothetical protein
MEQTLNREITKLLLWFGPGKSFRGLCAKGLVPNLWCYWEVVEPLSSGARIGCRSSGHTLEGDNGAPALTSICFLATMR